MATMIALFSQALYPKSWTIFSVDQFVSIEDANIPFTWYEADIEGSAILSWEKGVPGGEGGFADIGLTVPYPDGGIYKVSLISVIKSDEEQITGIWSVTKNDQTPFFGLGTATGLGGNAEDEVTITVNGTIIKFIILTKLESKLTPQNVTGQAMVNDFAVSNLRVLLRQKGAANPEQMTDDNGEYTFIDIEPANINRIVLGPYKNYNPDITVSGYIYVGGAPLVGAEVIVQNQSGVLTTLTTDADGYYESDSIIDAVGVDNNKIKVIIIP
jgi:hypothetical protein